MGTRARRRCWRRAHPHVLLLGRHRRIRRGHPVRRAGPGRHRAGARRQAALSERQQVRQPAVRLRAAAERVPDPRKDRGRRLGRDPLAHRRAQEVLRDGVRPGRRGGPPQRHPVRRAWRGDRAQPARGLRLDRARTPIGRTPCSPKSTEQLPRDRRSRLRHRAGRRAAAALRLSGTQPAARVRPHEIGARADQHEVPLRGRGGGPQDPRRRRRGESRACCPKPTRWASSIAAQGEAEAARIYAQALGAAPEFYRFLRTLEATRKFVGAGTTMVLPANSELFGLLYDSDHYRRRSSRRRPEGGDAECARAMPEERSRRPRADGHDTINQGGHDDMYERSRERTATAACRSVRSACAGARLRRRFAAEVEYDPGDTVYFTYCHAHPPALRINPRRHGAGPAPGTRPTTCSRPATRP